MKRYLLFAGEDCYRPQGGWLDFVGDYATLFEAHSEAARRGEEDHYREGEPIYDWAHAVDTSDWSTHDLDPDAGPTLDDDEDGGE